MENVPYEGGPKPLFGRGVIREVFLPPLFSTPPWHALRDSLVVTLAIWGHLDGCLGDSFLSSGAAGRSRALSIRVPNPNPVLGKNLAPHGCRNF